MLGRRQGSLHGVRPATGHGGPRARRQADRRRRAPRLRRGRTPYSAAYDIAAIGKVADYVDLMAYDEHGDGGTPGPVAGLDWDNAILQATLPDLNPAHVLLGVPLYGRAWGTPRRRVGVFERPLQRALGAGCSGRLRLHDADPVHRLAEQLADHVLRRRGQPGAQDRAGADLQVWRGSLRGVSASRTRGFWSLFKA